jgi:hypothetical protein
VIVVLNVNIFLSAARCVPWPADGCLSTERRCGLHAARLSVTKPASGATVGKSRVPSKKERRSAGR